MQDTFGNIQPNSVITVNQNGVPALLTAPLYADGSSSTTLSNPFVTPDGTVSFYLATPQRVDLVITAPGQAPYMVPDIDVEEPTFTSQELTFPGSGLSSTQIGNNAVATQNEAVAVGDTSAATQQQATAVGQSASASGLQALAAGQNSHAPGTQATALGASASAAQTGAVAVGYNALAAGNGAIAAGAGASASGVNSIALGNGAGAGNTNSTAIGPGAVTTEDDQIILGTQGTYVDIPNFMTLLSQPSQIKFRLYMTDGGALYTRYHVPIDATNLLNGQDQLNSNAGIGTWADGSNVTVAASTTYLFGTATGSMVITQTAAGPAYAAPAAVAVLASSWYVGKVWYYRPSGSGTATQFQTWIAFYNSSNALIGSALAGPPQTIVNGTWIVADVRAQAPSNAATAVLWAGVPSGGANSNQLWACQAGIFAVPQVI